MMNLLNITLINIKRFLKTPQIIIIVLIQVIFIGIFSINSGSTNNKLGDIAIINKDSGIYGNELVEYLKSNYNLSILENADSIKDSDVLVNIKENYSLELKDGKKPEIEIQGPENNGVLLAAINDIESFNNIKLKDNFIENYNENFFSFKDVENKGGENPMTFVMVCYFMLIGGSIISEDTIKLKQGNVLKRALTTANSSYTIIGGLFLAMLILQWGLTSIIFLAVNTVADLGIGTITALGIIFAFSALATSICLFTTRISKNQALASMIGIVYAVVAFIFMFLDMFKIGASEIISKISMLFPFYWVQKAMTGGSGVIAIAMILLMAGVFFTAGGFKYKNFISQL